jgi:hypothetical protein
MHIEVKGIHLRPGRFDNKPMVLKHPALLGQSRGLCPGKRHKQREAKIASHNTKQQSTYLYESINIKLERHLAKICPDVFPRSLQAYAGKQLALDFSKCDSWVAISQRTAPRKQNSEETNQDFDRFG